MAKEQDRKEIVSRIGDAAKLYRDRLVGKRFMYVFDGRYIEVIYKAENFRHLTGVETFLSAKRFYSYAARKILTADQIGFNAKHPYDLCVRKVEHIGEVATMAGSESFLLEEIKTDTQSYKFGTTDLNFTLGQFTRTYTQTVKRAADNTRRYAPGWVHSTCLLRGFSKGAAPHLAHDFAEQSVVCYTL